MMKNALILFVFSLVIALHGCKEDEDAVDEVQGFYLEKTSIEEGAATISLQIPVKLMGSIVSTLKVPYKLMEGTAKFGSDVVSKQGELEFQSENLQTNLAVEIVGDSHFELTESFELVITYNSVDYRYIIDIANDDPMGEILKADDGFYTPDAYESMKVVWKDEFGGTTLNSLDWGYDLGNGCSVGNCGWGNRELETYTNSPENIKLDNGKLVITALESSGAYTSSRIKTQGKVNVKFGRIDVRAKLPKGQGIWPAIWMLGENIQTVGWPVCGEIDIMELVGHQPSQTHGTVHFNSNGYKSSTGSTSLAQGDFSDQFHVFTIVWDKTQITWYVDNKPFKTYTYPDSSSPFTNTFFFIMNVAVGGNWPGPPNQTTVFPQQMVVDYIRVFQ